MAMKPKGLSDAELAKKVKCADADRLMKDAAKAAKKGFFSKPDWDAAAQAYDRAAGLYRSQQAFDEAVVAYEKAAHCHYENTIFGLSAKSLEAIAGIERDRRRYERAAEFYRKCSPVYVLAENFDRGAEAMVKAAKIMADVDVNESVTLYKEALHVYESNERQAMMGDTWRFALGTMVKAEMYDEAIALCERLFPMFEKLDQRPYWHRACLSIIIFQLTLNDYPAADRAFTEYCGSVDGFAMSEEGRSAELLMQAFDAGDPEEVLRLTSNQPFGFLENQVARTAKGLHRVVVRKEGLAPAEGGAAEEGGEGGAPGDELL